MLAVNQHGILRSLDGLTTLDIPAGAMTETVRVTHTPHATPEVARFLYQFDLTAHDQNGNDRHQFNRSITLTVNYGTLNRSGIAHDGLLTFLTFDARTDRWVQVDSLNDHVQHTLSVHIDHFSQWAVGDSQDAPPSVQGFDQLDQYSGAASVNYPIALPQIPGFYQPSLSLSYSSNGTNDNRANAVGDSSSTLGEGWSLSGLPSLSGTGPTFLTSPAGSGEIVTGTDAFSHTISESYVRIKGNLPDHNTWTLWDKSGTQYVLTGTTHSSTATNWNCGAEDWSDVYNKWQVIGITDTHGVAASVSYTTESHLTDVSCINGTDHRHYVSAAHPAQIRYDGGAVVVNFIYELKPNFACPQGSFAQCDSSRLHQIQVVANGNLLRTYTLQYDSERLRLVAITESGTQGPGGPSLPPTTFSYGESGIPAYYFPNMTLSGLPTLSRIDAAINMDWGTAMPDWNIPPDNWSARWMGYVTPPTSESYHFCTTTDDGVNLWVNNVWLVSAWYDQGATEHCGTISLTAGTPYFLKMEYYEHTGSASAKLSWYSNSVTKTVIPQANLSPDNRTWAPDDSQLLTLVDNGYGGQVEFHYISQTVTCQGTSCPPNHLFRAMVFSETERSLLPLSAFTKTYAYTGARYQTGGDEGAAPRFLGNSSVTETLYTSGPGSSPIRQTVQYFYQNLPGDPVHVDPRQGKVYLAQTLDPSGNVYLSTTNTYSYTILHDRGLAPAYNLNFVGLVTTTQSTCEGTTTCRQTRIVYNYDNYGNVSDEYMWGNLANAADAVLNKSVHRNFVVSTTLWIVDKPYFEKMYQTISPDDSGSNLLWQTTYYYDQHGASLAPSIGDVTQMDHGWAGTWASTGKTYDSYGNLIRANDPDNNVTTWKYDSIYHVLPVSVTNALNETSRTQYDLTLQKPVIITDANTNVTSIAYDVLGRQVSTTSPSEQGSAYPTAKFSFSHMAPAAQVITAANPSMARNCLPGQTA